MSIGNLLRRVKRSLFSAPRSDDFPIDAWTDEAYAKWFVEHKASKDELDEQRNTVFEFNPLFSIIVPLYKTPLDYLRMMVLSVLSQTYADFELILVNASPECIELKHDVESFCKADSRVKVVELDKNYGITENTNYGIDQSHGDYLCFLDHDDCIEPDLLFQYTKALNIEKDAGVLYCDEDLMRVDSDSIKYVNPLFKPDYSPELLLCKNYIVHMMCIEKSIVNSIERPTSVYDGAQDYNMVLYATCKAKKVVHIPKILYHWRISETSTAANPDAKPYSRIAYRRSASNQLRNRFDSARIIASGIINIHNVWFDRRPKTDMISVIVPIDNEREKREFLQLFLENNSYSNYEIVFVGRVSESKEPDKYFRVVEVDQKASVFERMNAGAFSARGDFLLFLKRGDFFQTAEPLEQLLALASQKEIGVSAPKSLYSDGTNKCFGVALTSKRIMPLYRGYPDDFPGYQCNLRAFQNVSATSKDGMMISKDIFEKVGGFDASYISEIGAADLCKRVTDIGYRIVMTPTVKLQTSDCCPFERYDNSLNALDFSFDDLAVFDRKWPGVRAAGDPYFNKNLDQSSSYFQIAKPNL